eukprot:11197135-Lingulodinium_polyedra.AAC.2
MPPGMLRMHGVYRGTRAPCVHAHQCKHTCSHACRLARKLTSKRARGVQAHGRAARRHISRRTHNARANAFKRTRALRTTTPGTHTSTRMHRSFLELPHAVGPWAMGGFAAVAAWSM